MISRFLRNVSALAIDRSGTAMVELAFITPIVVLIVMGTVDYSMLAFSKMKVQGAARQGAAYAVKNGWNSTGISNVVTSNSVAGGFLSAISANPVPTRTYGCANSSASVTAANSDTDTCSNGQTAGTYVTVSARATYTSLLPWSGIGTTFQVTSSIQTRIS